MRGRVLFKEVQRKSADVGRRPRSQARPTINTTPKPMIDQTEFNYEYCQFTMDLPIHQEVKNNLKYLYDLYNQFCRQGGLVSVVAGNKFQSIMDRMRGKFPAVSTLTQHNLAEHYIKYCLFSFEVVTKTGRRIENQNLSCLQITKFLSGERLKKALLDQQHSKQILGEDIVLLSNMAEAVCIDEGLFSLEKMCQKQGEEIVTVIFQDASEIGSYNDEQEDNGKPAIAADKKLQQKEVTDLYLSHLGLQRFKGLADGSLDPSNLAATERYQIELRQFYSYFVGCPYAPEEQKLKISKLRLQPLSNLTKIHLCQKAIYATEIDLKSDLYATELFKKLGKTVISYKQTDNLLSYTDEDIPGLTVPNFTLYTSGSWSGGAQQSLTKVDINFGPDPVEWFCISAENAPKFYSIFKNQYAINIEKIEGEWVDSIEWFLQRKIPIKTVRQCKGDAVVLGCGTVCWNLSRGKSLHCSWHIMEKSDRQILGVTSKDIINARVKDSAGQLAPEFTQKQPKIPFKAILLRALNHQEIATVQKQEKGPSNGAEALKNPEKPYLKSTSITMIREWLKKWYLQQQKYHNILIVKQYLLGCLYRLYHLFDAESYCINCRNQVQSYFVNHNGLHCLQCIYKLFAAKKIAELKDKTIYHKYDPFWLYQLIYYGNAREINTNTGFYHEYSDLCQGQFNFPIKACTKRKVQPRKPIEEAELAKQLQEIRQKQRQRDPKHIKILDFIKAKLQNKDLVTEAETQFHNKNCSAQTNLTLLEYMNDDIDNMLATQRLRRLTERKKQNAIEPRDQANLEVSPFAMFRKEKRISSQVSEQDGYQSQEDTRLTKSSFHDPWGKESYSRERQRPRQYQGRQRQDRQRRKQRQRERGRERQIHRPPRNQDTEVDKFRRFNQESEAASEYRRSEKIDIEIDRKYKKSKRDYYKQASISEQLMERSIRFKEKRK